MHRSRRVPRREPGDKECTVRQRAAEQEGCGAAVRHRATLTGEVKKKKLGTLEPIGLKLKGIVQAMARVGGLRSVEAAKAQQPVAFG